ncbi:MAG: ferritin family protein [Phycisphaerae bacterium]|jgi:rubrerythrin
MAGESPIGEEIWALAISMEQIGKDFYEALALGSDDPQVCRFCVTAAKDEARHRESFALMRSRLSESHRVRPLDERVVAELQALAKQQIQPDPAVVRKVALGGKLDDALKMASNMEKDAIGFYQGLLARLPNLSPLLTPIIAEEQSHLRSLLALGAALSHTS